MKYSLLSRFQGALLGSLVGELMVHIGSQERVLGRITSATPTPEEYQTNPTLSQWSQLTNGGTESLIRYNRLNLEDWWLLFEKPSSSVILKSGACSSGVALAALPIALFFHEDEVKLRQQLLSYTQLWQHYPESLEGVLAISYAIALAMTEKLDVATLIPQTLTYLGTTQTPLKQQLEQVQTLLAQGAGLETTLTQLRRKAQSRSEPPRLAHTSLALAFYCFLSTPEDFRLCVSRARRITSHTQTIAALTGVLAGVYNSLNGIPLNCRLLATRISSGRERLQLAERLFETWAGVYNVSALNQTQPLAVAAPRVIQSR